MNTSNIKGLGFQCSCIECGRVFDLLDEVDAQEWVYGHDCEVSE
jgi:hypothetical protein